MQCPVHCAGATGRPLDCEQCNSFFKSKTSPNSMKWQKGIYSRVTYISISCCFSSKWFNSVKFSYLIVSCMFPSRRAQQYRFVSTKSFFIFAKTQNFGCDRNATQSVHQSTTESDHRIRRVLCCASARNPSISWWAAWEDIHHEIFLIAIYRMLPVRVMQLRADERKTFTINMVDGISACLAVLLIRNSFVRLRVPCALMLNYDGLLVANTNMMERQRNRRGGDEDGKAKKETDCLLSSCCIFRHHPRRSHYVRRTKWFALRFDVNRVNC